MVKCYQCQHLHMGEDRCYVNYKYHPYTDLKNDQCEHFMPKGRKYRTLKCPKCGTEYPADSHCHNCDSFF